MLTVINLTRVWSDSTDVAASLAATVPIIQSPKLCLLAVSSHVGAASKSAVR